MRGWWRPTEPWKEALRPTWCWQRWSPSWPGKETPRWTFPCAYPADAELGRKLWAREWPYVLLAAALAARASRDLRRAAARLCKAPLATALSSPREARWNTAWTSVSSDVAAERTFLASVFNAVRTALLRRRRPSFCRLRLICDLMFATAAESSRAVPTNDLRRWGVADRVR